VASELRRIAQSLVARREERFATRRPRDEAKTRAEAALAAFRPRHMRIATRWTEDTGGLVLHAELTPTPRTQQFLRALSLGLVALLAASVWAALSDSVDRPAAFLAGITTALAVIGLPFWVAALATQREAEEARLKKALERALTDEDESGAGRSR
jgi:DNA-binding transcriptional MocR family regulator